MGRGQRGTLEQLIYLEEKTLLFFMIRMYEICGSESGGEKGEGFGH
jgi:hypothetical protein